MNRTFRIFGVPMDLDQRRRGGRFEIRSRLGQGIIATVQLPYDQTR